MPLTPVVIAHLNSQSLFMEDGVLRIHSTELLVPRATSLEPLHEKVLSSLTSIDFPSSNDHNDSLHF